MSQTAPDLMRVFLHDCKVSMAVGIYDHEVAKPQPVTVNIELEAALPAHYDDSAEKTVARVLNYELLYNFVTQELPKRGHIYLLETAADAIITFCFEDPRVRAVKVRIEKNAVFPQAAGAGVEFVRMREVKA